MDTTLVTHRLALTPITSSDAAALHAVWTDPAVRRFLWDNDVIPSAQTDEIIARNVRLFEKSGFGIWGVRERGSRTLVGFAGFWHFRAPPALELLFGVASTEWKRGIATESAARVMRYGFDVQGFESIDASTDVANLASIRVLEKLGMTLRERRTIDGLDTVFYRAQGSDWCPQPGAGIRDSQSLAAGPRLQRVVARLSC